MRLAAHWTDSYPVAKFWFIWSDKLGLPEYPPVYITLGIGEEMPGSPRIDKGEGFIRSHDLLQALRSDIDAAYAALEGDKSSQYLRRCVVRAIFSYIDAIVECVKVELRSTVRTGGFSGALNEKEVETLGPLAIIGTSQPGKFLPLDSNVKRTFRLATKIWGLKSFRLKTGDQDFEDFLAAKSARNRLTHPRTFYDIEVNDYDMHCHTIAGMWMQNELKRLFDARIVALAEDLPEEDRMLFIQRFATDA
jgi:hypothetical protein